MRSHFSTDGRWGGKVGRSYMGLKNIGVGAHFRGEERKAALCSTNKRRIVSLAIWCCVEKTTAEASSVLAKVSIFSSLESARKWTSGMRFRNLSVISAKKKSMSFAPSRGKGGQRVKTPCIVAMKPPTFFPSGATLCAHTRAVGS